MTIPQRITTPLHRLSPETLAEAKAARERIAEQNKRQRAADIAAEAKGEGRLLPAGRKNFHE